MCLLDAEVLRNNTSPKAGSKSNDAFLPQLWQGTTESESRFYKYNGAVVGWHVLVSSDGLTGIRATAPRVRNRLNGNSRPNFLGAQFSPEAERCVQTAKP